MSALFAPIDGSQRAMSAQFSHLQLNYLPVQDGEDVPVIDLADEGRVQLVLLRDALVDESLQGQCTCG